MGSKSYDANDSSWACNEDFVPANKYLVLKGFEEMEWAVIQAVVVQAVESYINSQHDSSVFTLPKVVTVGFDDGNLVRIK